MNLLNNSYLREVGDAQYKADAIKNVRFATTIETSDSIKQRVKARYFCPLSIRLEAFQRNCFDEHGDNTAAEKITSTATYNVIIHVYVIVFSTVLQHQTPCYQLCDTHDSLKSHKM